MVNKSLPLVLNEGDNSGNQCQSCVGPRIIFLTRCQTNIEQFECNNFSGKRKERETADLFQKYVEDQGGTVVDVLREFPSCQSITLDGDFT